MNYYVLFVLIRSMVEYKKRVYYKEYSINKGYMEE
jgi:hypothetical protein